jgi:hypothetical protein
LVWSILDTIYEHTQIDEVSYILLYDRIREYIYIYI